jgi:hypothetical protein
MKKIVIGVLVVAAFATLVIVQRRKAMKVEAQTVEISTGTVKTAK